MEFQSAQQISPETLQSVHYDIFILASGYEERSIYLPQHYHINADVKIALAFEEKAKELHRKDNDAYLLENGFTLVALSGEQTLDLGSVYSEMCKHTDKEHFYILVDYSSMTKVWYSGIINFFIACENSSNYLTVHFSYTPAIYNEPRKSGPVKFNDLVSFPGKKPSESPKQTALIIGLGLDNSGAQYIWKHLNPAQTFLVYADPTHDPLYVERVFKFNQELIEQTEVRNLIHYPLTDLEKTDEIITNLCLNLRIKYNVIIAPLGPKVLSLLVLLMASRYPDINVIRVSSGSNAAAFDRKPSSAPLVYSVEFVSDDLDF